MASFLRSSPPSLLLPLPPPRTQPSLLHPPSTQPHLIPFRLAGGLVARPNSVALPSLALPSRPTGRTLAASTDHGPLETATAAVNNLKEWWDSLGQQPSHLPTSTAWWKKRARKWLDGLETGFSLCLAVLLFRMGYNVLGALIVCGLMKLYLNIEADYGLAETQDTIDRIALRVRDLLMECQQDKHRSEAMEKKEPTKRTLGPILADSVDDDLPETMTTVNKLKEWWESLSQQPSHLPTTTAWWKKRARKWLDGFQTGFCLCLVVLLYRMGHHVLYVTLMAGGLVKFYLNMKADYRDFETRDTIDRIAHRIRGLLMDYQPDKQ